MTVEDLLSKLRNDERFKDNIAAWRSLPTRPARFTRMPANTHSDLVRALEASGIDALYLHQREAAEMALKGNDVVVATPTASGKSLCYNIPVVDRILKDPAATALYLFPTKALSQDQVASLMRLNRALPEPVPTMTYDGDTPAPARKIIRETGRLVVTNPYMLHAGIMPNHSKWVRFFQGLAFVVIDEVHTLTGVFGSHFANLMRRLQRLCRHYGSEPVYILCSATIANPAELASTLIGRPVLAITDDGSPQGEKHFVFYNPPLVNPEMGLRRSSLEEARRLTAFLSIQGVQTLTFCRSRTAVEVLVKYLRDHFVREGLDLSRVRGYRGGYLPLLRRQIEKGLREGEIDAVVATNALELGIDIGSLDACILTGYPGSIASTLQQAGRAGRKASSSVAVVIGRANATDQYVLNHPEYVLEQAPEAGAVDPDNLIIKVNQMKCAAFELPFGEGERFGEARETREILEYLEKEARILRKVKERWYWMSREFPAEKVSLHSGDMDNFVVMDGEERKAIGEVDRPSAMSMIHPGAIYGHQGEQYIIENLDYEHRQALAIRLESDYYTEAEVETDIKILHLDSTLDFGSYSVHLGEIGVTKTATLFKKIRYYTRENLGTGVIDLPSESMHTEAMILTLEPGAAARVGLLDGNRSGSFLGFARLLLRVAPLFVRCDMADLGVKAEIASSHFHCPAVILFDEIPGGVGLSEAASRRHRHLVRAMRSIVTGCECKSGCPCCIDPAPQGMMKHKSTVLSLIDLLLTAPEKGRRVSLKIEAAGLDSRLEGGS
ncbi:MAG: DEAD/DEAH box helicase [Planctomycetota bacterium]|jgi:DEAD/DEAH box helicase domain-containing protein